MPRYKNVTLVAKSYEFECPNCENWVSDIQLNGDDNQIFECKRCHKKYKSDYCEHAYG